MKKFVESTDPVVKSAMDEEELMAKASLSEEQDISNLIAKGEEDDEAEDQVRREPPDPRVLWWSMLQQTRLLRTFSP